MVVNVDLKAKLPQTLIRMLTKKVAADILGLLNREAQKVTVASHREASQGAATDNANPYLRLMARRQTFYSTVRALVQKYFDIFGPDAAAQAQAP